MNDEKNLGRGLLHPVMYDEDGNELVPTEKPKLPALIVGDDSIMQKHLKDIGQITADPNGVGLVKAIKTAIASVPEEVVQFGYSFVDWATGSNQTAQIVVQKVEDRTGEPSFKVLSIDPPEPAPKAWHNVTEVILDSYLGSPDDEWRTDPEVDAFVDKMMGISDDDGVRAPIYHMMGTPMMPDRDHIRDTFVDKTGGFIDIERGMHAVTPAWGNKDKPTPGRFRGRFTHQHKGKHKRQHRIKEYRQSGFSELFFPTTIVAPEPKEYTISFNNPHNITKEQIGLKHRDAVAVMSHPRQISEEQYHQLVRDGSVIVNGPGIEAAPKDGFYDSAVVSGSLDLEQSTGHAEETGDVQEMGHDRGRVGGVDDVVGDS